MEFLNKVNQFISSKNYANKGIRTKDGKLAYVTSTGVTKPFTSLESSKIVGANCPNEFVQVDQTWQNLGFPVGSLMQNGQSCGNEGKYVRGEPPTTDFDWKFYLQNNGDLPAAGLTTEQQATSHWNSNGKAEGRVPNATIFSSMGSLGKVGYVDIDTVFHSVTPTYSGQYSSFPNRTNITGTAMTDCSTPAPFLKYGDTVILMQNNQTGSLNSSSLLQFGSGKTNLFLRPPPGDDRTGIVIKSGDTICISSSSSSYTNDCGWWGCKVAKISEQNQLLFSAGSSTPQQFRIISLTVEQGKEMRMDNSFYFISIPKSNKANLPLNASVNCTAGKPNGMPSGIYRYSGANELNYYPTPDVASSWNSDWGSVTNADCSTYKFGDTLTKKNVNNLEIGKSAGCNWNKPLKNGVDGGIYRYVGENILRWYPNPSIAFKWDPGNWWKYATVDCGSYTAGPPMDLKNDGIGKELIDMPKYVYVSNGITLLGTLGEINATTITFSFQTPTYNRSCDIGTLQKTCNSTADCIGFVQAPANNTWQMIKTNSSASNYKITSTMQDVHLKEATVDVGDDSCDPGPVSFIKGTVLEKYPKGTPFEKGKGTGKCKIITAPKGNVQNDVPKAKEIVDKFPKVRFDKEPTTQMKNKTAEYEDVIQRIKTTKPSVTLEQQYTDMQVFDEKNKTSLIVWSVLSITILGFVFFRMKS